MKIKNIFENNSKEIFSNFTKTLNMNFWKKLFGKKEEDKNIETKSEKKPVEFCSKSIEELENILKPHIKTATKIEVLPARKPPENSQYISHFGGDPYFEKGEFWPKNNKNQNLSFVFQIFNSKDFELPKNIGLIQFYYDYEEFPWDTSSDGWLVKIYKKIDNENSIFIPKPEELEESKFCQIKFKNVKSLPDWDGIDTYLSDFGNLDIFKNHEDPWDLYEQIVSNLIGEQDYQSQLGGYPKWVQGESTPEDKNGGLMKLLFQIDSEEEAGLMWGDVGVIYVFYDEETERIEFTLQCC